MSAARCSAAARNLSASFRKLLTCPSRFAMNPVRGDCARLLRTYLTREMMSQLQLLIYWKHGLNLRPVKDVKQVEARLERIVPFARGLAAELPVRFEWSYQLLVPSAGVPLTDSLVFVFRTTEERVAARVAARL